MCQRAKEVEEVEVLRCVVLREVLFVHFGSGEAVVNPVQQFFASAGVRGDFFKFSHGVVLSGFLVFTDQQLCVGEVHVWRYFEVVWRGLVFKHATSNIKRGTMAWAQKAAIPVIGQ
jgi:hypothetical protein